MEKDNARVFRMSMPAVGVFLLCTLPLAAQDNNTYVQHAVRFAISSPLRTLAMLPRPSRFGFHEANPVRRVHESPDTVDLKLVGGTGLVLKGIPWGVLTFLDKSREEVNQAAAQKG